jgi:hypothetical protein
LRLLFQQKKKEQNAMPPPSALPDMTAALAAKVVAPASDAATLSSLYADMAAAWAAHGPDEAAIASTAHYYDGSAPPRPLAYTAFSPPLAPAAVRLLAFFLLQTPDGDDPASGGPALAAAAMAAADAVAAVLPPSARLHRSRPAGLHLTLFMTSQPFALCGDPFGDHQQDGGQEQDSAVLGAPAPGVVEREVEATRALAAATRPARPAFVTHSIALARSGALLLLLTEAGGGSVVSDLRARARTAFPAAPPTQATILHVTLGRLLSPLEASDSTTVAAVAAAAAAATERVKGMRWSPGALSHICEEVFATVAGPRVDAPFL